MAAALGGGWLWGASGKAAVEQERRGLQERADLSEARASILDGCLSASEGRFDEASARFAAARAIVERVQIRVRETGQAERAGQLAIVLAELKDAERLSRALDPSARTSAERAVQALRSVTPGAT